MKEYLDMVKHVIDNGELKQNRTGVDTISTFAYHYKVNVGRGFPLLTTKKIFFKSLMHEIIWYLSGDDHIRDLKTKTKIWDAWADENDNLETAYGRFWRRFPVPAANYFPEHEAWAQRDENNPWVKENNGVFEFDQVQYIIDTLKELHTNPEAKNGRRMIISAWNPANASVSKLPPCHLMMIFNLTGGKLNLHLTQRSGDVGLGIPFNLACYSLLLELFAKLTGWSVGEFSHTIIDCHIYENHIEGLTEQLERPFYPLPKLKISDRLTDINDVRFEDFEVVDYLHHPYIKLPVAI